MAAEDPGYGSMSKRIRRVDFIKSELKKSRSEALAFVQTFNNSNISFNSESYAGDDYRLALSSQRLFSESKNIVSVLRQNAKSPDFIQTRNEGVGTENKLFLLNNICNVIVQKNVAGGPWKNI
jgi:hypothetical protein